MLRIARPVLFALSLSACSTGAARSAANVAERDVSFSNGEVELKGTLVRPVGEGPFPAIVFLHGSGPATREGALRYAREFARLGVAGLAFDKRGAGESGGSWLTSSLQDLADDALAAVSFLKEQDAIDAERIGLWGVSQAAWVAPVAASRSDDIAFMMLISGGGATPRESEMFSYRHQFERAGLSAVEADRAGSILNDYFDFLATGDGRPALEARLDSIRSTRLAPLADEIDGIMVSDENRPNWAWVASHDPAEHIGSVRVPVLLLFGDRDTEHPTELAIERWRQGLARAGNDDVTIRRFREAGHGIRMRNGHRSGGRAPFADGYMEAQLEWLRQHVLR